MTDTRAMAFVNLYGVLAALENLCALDQQAQEILKKITKQTQKNLTTHASSRFLSLPG